MAAALFLGEEPDSLRGISSWCWNYFELYDLWPPKICVKLFTGDFFSKPRLQTSLSVVKYRLFSMIIQLSWWCFVPFFQSNTLNQLARTAHNNPVADICFGDERGPALRIFRWKNQTKKQPYGIFGSPIEKKNPNILLPSLNPLLFMANNLQKRCTQWNEPMGVEGQGGREGRDGSSRVFFIYRHRRVCGVQICPGRNVNARVTYETSIHSVDH